MSEAEWLACTDPTTMLVFLWDRASERKLRLFACAVHRRMYHFADEGCVVTAAEASERYADGRATAEEMREARSSAMALWSAHHVPNPSNARLPRGLVIGAACQVTRTDVAKVVTEIEQVARSGGVDEWERAGLVRELFGNPFRPVVLDHSWLTSTVLSLAEVIYAEYAFDRLPILADALMDAGCDDPMVLNHCRDPNLNSGNEESTSGRQCSE